MQLPGVETRVLPDGKAVAAAAAEAILAQGRAAVAERGEFKLVLAGGTTPEAAYRLLAASGQDWSAWRFFIGDERCLPPADPTRNSLMVRQRLLAPAGIAEEQFAPMPAELGPEAAAAAYAPLIGQALPVDLVLLGMGEDGHTASLFPDLAVDWAPASPGQALVMAVRGAPKPPPERVSLTPRALLSCRRMLVMITKADKHEALLRWQAGESLPVARVAREAGALVLLDQAAASGDGG
jgi:6-phosphogluconolactonase